MRNAAATGFPSALLRLADTNGTLEFSTGTYTFDTATSLSEANVALAGATLTVNGSSGSLQVASPFRRLGPHTDDQGYCTFAVLVPGATYRFGQAEIQTTFTAESGRTVQVPDVVVKAE